MTDNEIIRALEICNAESGSCIGCSLRKLDGCVKQLQISVLDLINRQKAEIERLEYVLMGVMHSVDKWLEGDELKQDEVNRAATMREKTLQILEDSQDGHIRTIVEKDAEIERLRMQQSELIADYKQIAINAMKKFVERFKTKLSNFEYRDENPNMKQKGEWILHEVIPIEVDNLLKEMDGDKS